MQQDNSQVDLHRQQLLTTLGQAADSLRNAATMAEGFAALVQALPVGPSPHSIANIPSGLIPQIAPQSMFQVLTPSGHNQDQAPPGSGVAGRRRGRGAGAGARVGAGVGGEAEDGRKRKRRGEKKQRDPDAPKRPPSAYLLFQNEVRKEMQALYPDRPYHEVLSKIAARWSAMGEGDKKVYLDLTAESKAQFEVAKAAYDAKLAGANGAVHAAIEPVVPITEPTGAGTAQLPTRAVVVEPAAGSGSESDEEDVSEPLSPVEAKTSGATAPDTSEGSSGDEEEEEEEEEQLPARPPASKRSKPAEREAPARVHAKETRKSAKHVAPA